MKGTRPVGIPAFRGTCLTSETTVIALVFAVLVAPQICFRSPVMAQETTAPITAASADTTTAAGPSAMAVLFTEKCYSCHTIGGGDKTGPDLQGVTDRRSSDWLVRFIGTPRAVYRSGDAAAVELFRRFSPDVMPDQAMGESEILDLLAFLGEVTASGRPFVPVGGGLSRAMIPEDVPAGRDLFIGRTPLSTGGPSCVSCHTTGDLRGFGGGTLGPDLTKSNVLYSEAELVNILRNPAFPTMAPLYAQRPLDDEEIVQLYAYLNEVSASETVTAAGYFAFTASGMLLSLVALGLLAVLWRHRLRGVRQPFVEEARQRMREGGSR